MGKSKDLATGASYVDTAGDTMTGELVNDSIYLTNNVGQKLFMYRDGNVKYGLELQGSDFRVFAEDQAAINLGHTARSDGSTFTSRLGVDSSGRVTIPSQPSFFVQKNDGNHTTSANIVYNNVVHNVGSHYSTSNGRFTAPVAGKYLFSATGICGNSTSTLGNGDVRITVNGSTYVRGHFNHDNQWESVTSQAVISLNANDYVNIYFEVGSNSTYMYGAAQYAVFSGHLLG